METRATAKRDVVRVSEGGRTRSPFLRWPRVLEWLLIPLAFVLMRFVPERPTRLAGWLLLLFAGSLFASPAMLASYREHRKDRVATSAQDLAVEYRIRLGLTLGEAVIPIGDLLGRAALADSAERAGLQGQLRQRVVDAAAALAGPARARAVLFVLVGRTLRAAAWAGRPDPPATALLRTDPAAEAAYELMEHHDRLLVPDVADSEAIDVGLGGTYATYLAVAVYAGSLNFGIVSVDAPVPDVLDESDLDIAAALAQMLGAGLALGQSGR